MRFRRSQDEEPDLNLIPLIDILLVVLIFLAVSTSYSRFTELQIELPRADATKSQSKPNEIQVGVTADGRVAIDRALLPSSEPAAISEPLRRAAQKRDNPLVVINADAQAPHQAVVNVMEGARLAGLARINFATQRATSLGGS
jgi:biopolymer transport protein ExbD